MTIDRRFFEGLMRDKDISLRSLAKLMGLSHSQLSLTFSGERRLQLSEAIELSNLFGVPLSRIVQAMGIQTAPTGDTRVTVIGSVQGDGSVRLHDQGTVDRTSAPVGVPDDGLAVQFKTAGTALDYLDAAVMFCGPMQPVSASCMGRLCLVQSKGGPLVVAAVRRGYAENSYNLSGLYQRENVLIETAAPVLFTRH